MNFKTRQSYNNRLMFVYPSGEVKATRFIEIAYYGDNYILAKNSDDVFYTLLDLDGNEVEKDMHIVHRFQNGMLLTYSFFSKQYTSSDACKYSVNYNVYKILNYTTGKSSVISVVQSDNLLITSVGEPLQDKCRKNVVKDFLNKPVYCFKDFVFSEVLDFQYIIVGSFFNLGTGAAASFNFENFKDKKIWGVVNISATTGYNGQTDINDQMISKLTFKEAELHLMELLAQPEKPFEEDYNEKELYEEVTAEFKMYNSWRKKNRWQLMLSRMLSTTSVN